MEGISYGSENRFTSMLLIQAITEALDKAHVSENTESPVFWLRLREKCIIIDRRTAVRSRHTGRNTEIGGYRYEVCIWQQQDGECGRGS